MHPTAADDSVEPGELHGVKQGAFMPDNFQDGIRSPPRSGLKDSGIELISGEGDGAVLGRKLQAGRSEVGREHRLEKRAR